MERAEVLARVTEAAVGRLGRDEVPADARLVADLGADPLDVVDLGVDVEEAFDVRVLERLRELTTLDALTDAVLEQVVLEEA